MASTFNSPIEIQPPFPTVLPNLLVDAAEPIVATEAANAERWRAGVTFVPFGSANLTRFKPDLCDEDAIGTPFDTEDCPTFTPFGIYGAELGGTLDWTVDQLQARVDARFTTMVSEQLAAEMFASAVDPNFATSAQVITGGGPVDYLFALATVEFGLGMVLHGGKGLVWVPPGALTAISYALNFIDGTFYTPAGHRVVSDPGSLGHVPEGVTPDPATNWLWGSGPVQYAIGRARTTSGNAEEYLDRTTNKQLALRTHDAIVAFDPGTVVAAEGTTVAGS